MSAEGDFFFLKHSGAMNCTVPATAESGTTLNEFHLKNQNQTA